MVDKRKEDRQPIDYPCWLDLGSEQPAFECRLSNVSKSGALLASGTEVPDEFALYLTRDGKIGRQCKVVRRDKNNIGLLFMGREVPKPKWLEPRVADA